MTSWVLPAFWLEVNPLTDIWRSFRHLAHEHSLLETTVAILGTSLVLAILARGNARAGGAVCAAPSRPASGEPSVL